jgi:hypothetical protein
VRTEPFPGWPKFGALEEQEWMGVLRSGKWFRGYGKAVDRFEEKYAALVGDKAEGVPLGEVKVDEALSAALLSEGGLLRANPKAHADEHSIEVQVPFIQELAPSAKLLPILVPPSDNASEVGRIVAEQTQTSGRKVVFLGSTDLTTSTQCGKMAWMGTSAWDPRALGLGKTVTSNRTPATVVLSAPRPKT